LWNPTPGRLVERLIALMFEMAAGFLETRPEVAARLARAFSSASPVSVSKQPPALPANLVRRPDSPINS